MLYYNILVLCSISLYPVVSKDFVTGVRLRTNAMPLNNATACGELQAMSQELWKIGSFQSCHVLNIAKRTQNLYDITFRIVTLPEKIEGYGADTRYFATAALINLRLNNDRRGCSTITGKEWMDTVSEVGNTFTFKAYYPGNPISSNCNTLLNIAHHTIEGQTLVGCDAIAIETSTENDTAVYFAIRLKISRTTPLLSSELFRTLTSVARIINHNGRTCISVESVITRNGWRRLIISVNGVGNIIPQNICKWFVLKYTISNRTGHFYDCKYQLQLAYRNAAFLSLDLRESLDGIPIEIMSHAEIAWRTESLFNSGQDECISYDPEAINSVFQKTTNIEFYDTYLSGPVDEELCDKVNDYYRRDYMEMFSTCSRNYRTMLPNVSAKFSLHVLQSNKPIYLIDYSSYVNSHIEMLYAFNQVESKCKYNGFVIKSYSKINLHSVLQPHAHV